MTTATETRTQITPEGTRVWCPARDGARTANFGNNFSRPIWTGGIYEAKRRQDGIITWRRVGSFGGTRSGIAPSESFRAELAEQIALPELHVRHGKVCD